jgi:hypothetical protein
MHMGGGEREIALGSTSDAAKGIALGSTWDSLVIACTPPGPRNIVLQFTS